MKTSAISSLNLRAHGRSVLTSLLSQIDFSMDKMNEIFFFFHHLHHFGITVIYTVTSIVKVLVQPNV